MTPTKTPSGPRTKSRWTFRPTIFLHHAGQFGVGRDLKHRWSHHVADLHWRRSLGNFSFNDEAFVLIVTMTTARVHLLPVMRDDVRLAYDAYRSARGIDDRSGT